MYVDTVSMCYFKSSTQRGEVCGSEFAASLLYTPNSRPVKSCLRQTSKQAKMECCKPQKEGQEEAKKRRGQRARREGTLTWVNMQVMELNEISLAQEGDYCITSLMGGSKVEPLMFLLKRKTCLSKRSIKNKRLQIHLLYLR